MRPANDADGLGRLGELVEALADEIADRVAARLSAPQDGGFYSAKDPGPFKTSRAFLDAARRGEFPTARVAREVVARRSDVDAAIAARLARRTPRPEEVKASDADTLREMGVELRAAGGRR